MKRKIAPELILIIGILAASTASIFIRFAQVQVPSLVIAAYRLGLATLFLVPAASRSSWKPVTGLQKTKLSLIGLAGLFLAFHFASWITSLEYTSVASAAILVASTPLWVALFSPFVLKEHLTKKAALGLGVALVGAILVGMGNTCIIKGNFLICDASALFHHRALLGDFLALAGAIFGAGYLIVGRKMRDELPFTNYIFLVYGTAAVLLWIAVLTARLPITGFSRISYLWLLLLAIVPQLIGHSSFNWALRFMPASLVSIALLSEPIGATFLAFIFLGEVPLPLEIIGGAITLVGIYLASQAGSQSSQASSLPKADIQP